MTIMDFHKNIMTQNTDIAYQIGYAIGIGSVIALVIWAIWAIWKYKPFSKFVQVGYDFRTFVIQVVAMYGNKPSFFSIKRFHNGLITYWSLITASLFIRHNKISAAELMMIITPFLGVAGYNIFQSQQDKKVNIADKAVDNATDIVNKITDNAADLENKKEDKI
jgi:hypothetical protein